jgi:hypothetical protein
MTIEQFNEYKESCILLIDQAKSCAKLVQYPEFQAIIMEGYLTYEPHRLGALMASGRMPPKQFDGCIEDLRGIANLRKYLQDFIQKGNIAADELENLEIAFAEVDVADG